jgi:hypothetical protein
MATDVAPDSPLFPNVQLPSVSVPAFQVQPAYLQLPPPPPNAQPFSVYAGLVLPTGPSQADILEAQRKEVERMRRKEQAKARKLRKQQEQAAQARAAMERATQEWGGLTQRPMPPMGFTAYSNNQVPPPTIASVQHSIPAFRKSATGHAPILSTSWVSRNDPQTRAPQYPPCPLCSDPHEPGQCPALNDLPSLYFFREQIQNEPGIETSEERVSRFILAIAHPDDHLSETPCKRSTTSSPKPRHDSKLLLPSHLHLTPLVYSQALPHLPETLLLSRGLKESRGHHCLAHILRSSARPKAYRQASQPVNALNTMLFWCRTPRREQMAWPLPPRHNLRGVQYVKMSPCIRC